MLMNLHDRGPSTPDPRQQWYKNKRRRTMVAIGALTVLFLITGMIVFHRYLRSGMPPVEALETFEPQLSTKLLDRQGEVIKELFTQRRFYVSLNDISPRMVQAILATEDHKFYEHWGIRPVALATAVAEGVLTLDFHFRGASTLTQQLARNLHYSSQRTILRKMREALTAVEIERYYSKDEILEMYLTQTYFGAGAYGVEAAANTYFSKPATDLLLEEAALLAAIPKSPTRYNPINNPENAFARRNIVLRRMAEVGYISHATYDSLREIPIGLATASTQGTIGIAPYFTENVRQQLNTIGKEFGFDPYHDGMTVQTTLDSRLQVCAETAIAKHLPEVQKHVSVAFRDKELTALLAKFFPDSSVKARRKMATDKKFVDSLANIHMPVQVAFVAIDPANGNILAMVGGRDFEESKFNRATQAIRQPGSSFKPFVYASCVDKGFPICGLISNEELTVHQQNGDVWSPGNYDGDYGGQVDMREGLKRSLNVVCARLIREHTTPFEVAGLAKKMGITTRLDPFDALALGASGVIPLDLVSSYQPFLTNGVYNRPSYILSVDDAQGQTIVTYRPEKKAVLSEETAFLIRSLMETVTNSGTAASLRSTFGFREPAAGKTGTTNDFTDAWFVGFTPYVVAGVWVGMDDPAKPLGRGMQGGRAALPIWASFMTQAYDTMHWKHSEFPPAPKRVTSKEICEESGELATSNCEKIRAEYFNEKFPFPPTCSMHSGVRHDKSRKPRLL